MSGKLPELKRYMRLGEVRKLLGEERAWDISTLERWCRTGRWPAKRGKGRGRPWLVDLRRLKMDAVTDGRDLYEEMVENVNTALDF